MSEQIWQVEQSPKGPLEIDGACKCNRFRWRSPYWIEWALADWKSQPQVRTEALGLTTGYCYSCGYRLAPDGCAYRMVPARALGLACARIYEDLDGYPFGCEDIWFETSGKDYAGLLEQYYEKKAREEAPDEQAGEDTEEPE